MVFINRSACVSAVTLILLVVDQSKGQSIFLHGIDNSLLRRKQFEETKGSVYLNELWSLGTLISKEGNEYSGLLLRYDAYQDVVEVNSEGQIFIASADDFPAFSLSISEPGTNTIKKHYFSSGYNLGGFNELNYVELLAQGKVDLIAKDKIDLLEDNIGKYGTPGSYRSYQARRFYFVMDTRGTSLAIKLSKKSILEIFPKNAVEIEAFLKKKKMKIKSETHLIEVINYLNESVL